MMVIELQFHKEIFNYISESFSCGIQNDQVKIIIPDLMGDLDFGAENTSTNYPSIHDR